MSNAHRLFNLFTKEKSAVRGEETFVVAEIGKNFITKEAELTPGEYRTAAEYLIEAAARAGADAVKFQTHDLEDEQLQVPIASPHFKNLDRYSWLARNVRATPPSFWEAVKAHAARCGVAFFSTPMSRRAAERLQAFGVSIWKVGSGDVLDFSLLDFLVRTKNPIILSTGMVSFGELDSVVVYLRKADVSFAILHCVSEYPTPPAAVNLSTIEALAARYPGIPIGFSDHSVGEPTIPLAAVKLGACIVEKHFSFDRTLWGPDHQVSLTPSELRDLVSAIRLGAFARIDHAPYYGTLPQELPGASSRYRPFFHKTLVASQDLAVGTVLSQKHLFSMRPRLALPGLPSEAFHEVLGRRLSQTVKKYQPIAEAVLYAESYV